MAKRLITAAGAVCIAAALGSGSLSAANGVVIGLLLSTAVGVWGTFALVLWGMPGRG